MYLNVKSKIKKSNLKKNTIELNFTIQKNIYHKYKVKATIIINNNL